MQTRDGLPYAARSQPSQAPHACRAGALMHAPSSSACTATRNACASISGAVQMLPLEHHCSAPSPSALPSPAPPSPPFLTTPALAAGARAVKATSAPRPRSCSEQPTWHGRSGHTSMSLSAEHVVNHKFHAAEVSAAWPCHASGTSRTARKRHAPATRGWHALQRESPPPPPSPGSGPAVAAQARTSRLEEAWHTTEVERDGREACALTLRTQHAHTCRGGAGKAVGGGQRVGLRPECQGTTQGCLHCHLPTHRVCCCVLSSQLHTLRGRVVADAPHHTSFCKRPTQHAQRAETRPGAPRRDARRGLGEAGARRPPLRLALSGAVSSAPTTRPGGAPSPSPTHATGRAARAAIVLGRVEAAGGRGDGRGAVVGVEAQGGAARAAAGSLRQPAAASAKIPDLPQRMRGDEQNLLVGANRQHPGLEFQDAAPVPPNTQPTKALWVVVLWTCVCVRVGGGCAL